MIHTWVRQELQAAELGDKRLNTRLMKLVEALIRHPSSSVPEACGSWAETKAAYRFWDSDDVTSQMILEAHQKSTLERVSSHAFIFIAQDTTEVSYKTHPATEGLGYLSNSRSRGLLVHSSLAISSEGVPLGLIHQEIWMRPPEEKGSTKLRRSLKTSEKESQKWITALRVSQEVIPAEKHVIVLADREADVFDFFSETRRDGVDFLIRVAQNRLVEHEERKLKEAIEASAPQGKILVEIPRKGEQPVRQAELTIRFSSLKVHPPHKRKGQPVELQIILAKEEILSGSEEPICWWLATTLPVTSIQEAQACVRWYSYRWLVERYHYVLKSGCQVEKLQLETAERLERALATYCIVAWRLLWLTYQSRISPHSSCEMALEEYEWRALYCYTHKTTVLPPHPPEVREVILWLAKLGGFLARRRDGPPGAKVIWRGLRRLEDISATWSLLYDP